MDNESLAANPSIAKHVTSHCFHSTLSSGITRLHKAPSVTLHLESGATTVAADPAAGGYDLAEPHEGTCYQHFGPKNRRKQDPVARRWVWR